MTFSVGPILAPLKYQPTPLCLSFVSMTSLRPLYITRVTAPLQRALRFTTQTRRDRKSSTMASDEQQPQVTLHWYVKGYLQ